MKHYTVPPLKTDAARRQFVKECDLLLEQRMQDAIRSLEALEDLRFFGLTGPTCSGKTTAAFTITRLLEARGRAVHVISLDDFYYDKEYLHRRAEADPDIEIDYDSEQTIDVSLLSEQAENLYRGLETHIPHFDFKSGMRKGEAVIRPKENDVFLFEGIQTLYPNVSAILDRHHTYRSLAICPTSSIEVGGSLFEPNEIRLYRRLVRDFRHRATSPEFTFYLWQSVRANEEKNIFPNLGTCHATIDSALPYEIGMLKPYLVPLLQAIPSENAFYGTAQGILKKLAYVQPIPSAYMTEQSLYKEFI